MRIRAEKYLSKASVCLKEGKTYPLAMYVDIVVLDKIHEILGCEYLDERDASAALYAAFRISVALSK